MVTTSRWLDRKTVREVNVELNRVFQIHKQKTMILARGRLVQLLKNLHGVYGRQRLEQRLLLLGAPQGQDDIEPRIHLHWRANRV